MLWALGMIGRLNLNEMRRSKCLDSFAEDSGKMQLKRRSFYVYQELITEIGSFSVSEYA